MSLEALLERVARDARLQARGILADAREEARRLVREAEERVARELEARLKKTETNLRRDAARRLVAAEQEGRATELAARERYFERVFEVVRERLEGPESIELLRYELRSRLARLLSYAPDRPAAIHCSPALAPEIEKAIENEDGIGVMPDGASSTSLAVEARAGALLVDDSLERRLEAMVPALRIELAREVGEEP